MKKGFTLIEVLIVIAIFSVVSLVSINVFLTTFRVSQQTEIENSILDDARFIMAQLIHEIETNTIDYEEYFSHCVANEDCPNILYSFNTSDSAQWIPGSYAEFGRNYGLYNWQFFYGGVTNTADDSSREYDGFGTICQEYNGPSSYVLHDYPNDLCDTGPLSYSEDLDTGKNPNNVRWFDESDGSATAFCSNTVYQLFHKDSGVVAEGTPSTLCTELNTENTGTFMMDELYLVDNTGQVKTIFTSETVSRSGDKAVSKLEMTKFAQAQSGSNQAMPLFGFTCSTGYNCSLTTLDLDSRSIYESTTAMSIPLRYDPYVYNSGEDIFTDFVPVSPLRVNIKSLKFLVSPLEDPRRSFDESDDMTKLQPSVTVFLELEPSSEFKSPFLSKNFNLKLQTTVTSGIINEVPIVSDSE